MFDNFFLRKKREREVVSGKTVTTPKNIHELLSQHRWEEIFSDSSQIPLSDPALSWLEPPSEDFMRYVLERTPLGFDGVPPDETLYKRQPTFMLAQIHRLWVTMRIIQQFAENRSDFSLLDVGAFPFSLDIILREYVKFSGEITVTTNWNLEEPWIIALRQRSITVKYTNLDPFVGSGIDLPELKNYLDIPDNSVDLVVCTHVIEHLYHPYCMIKDIFRVLKPGGKIVITTDNAFMLSAFFNVCNLNDYLHEPVEGTAAMSFHQWRGHNRFYSCQDIKTLLESAGFRFSQVHYYELLYNSFNNEFFKHPVRSLPKWKAEILKMIPAYRNEIVVIGEKVNTG
jgi:SAM-dependent methyltransferase